MSRLKDGDKERSSSRTIIGIAAIAAIAAILYSSYKKTYEETNISVDNKTKTINVYTNDGSLISTYNGIINVETYNDYIKFSYDGKNYVYYDCSIEIIEDQ